MREGIAGWLDRTPDLEVCGQAESAAAAVRLIGELKPDMLVTDLSLPNRHGIDLTRDAHAIQPDLPVLVLSVHNETIHAGAAIRAGAAGYLMKGENGHKLVAAIRHILAGGVYVTDRVAHQILDTITKPRWFHAKAPVDQLTARERELFELLGHRLAPSAISQSLHLDAKTLATEQAGLRAKLKLTNHAALVHLAVLWIATSRNTNHPYASPDS